MKFVHIADMHFDSPFVNLSDKDILGDLRRIEQRKIFRRIIDYIKENRIEYFFIAGDLYEHKYVKQSTIEYINNLFKEIPETQIFITPGNHDPYVKNSYYNKFKWHENVKIFNAKIEKIQLEEVDIYGYGFDDFYCHNSGIEELEIENKEKINILITHSSLDGGLYDEKNYNTLSSKKIINKEFDYVALGHIHKPGYKKEEHERIIYPGSTTALGFDEPGEHGMMVGDLQKEEFKLKFIPLDEECFVKKEIDVTNIVSKEELIENINAINLQKNEYVEIILKGNRNFEIDKYDLLKYIFNEKIIKIKDQTKIAYNLEKISNTTTLKGLFIKEMLKKLKNENITEEEKKTIEKAIEIGLEALE